MANLIGNSNYMVVLTHWSRDTAHVVKRLAGKKFFASHCTAVCRVRRQSTWATVALQSQTLLADATYTRLVDITCLYHVTGLVPSAVGPSRSVSQDRALLLADGCHMDFIRKL